MPTEDKLPPIVAATAAFTGGESPSASKLTITGTQLAAAARILERALGDLRGQRAPYITSVAGTATQQLQQASMGLAWGRDRASGAGGRGDSSPLTNAPVRTLDIVSLARLIGPASMLNPYTMEANDVTETVSAGFYETDLEWPVDVAYTSPEDPYPTVVNLQASTWASTDTSLDPANYVQGPDNLTSANEWTLDAHRGIAYSFTATSGGTVTYPVDPSKFFGGMNYPGARFNVIPDPAQLESGGVSLSISGPTDGIYTITLPAVDAQQTNLEGSAVETSSGSYADVNDGVTLKLPAFLDGLAAGTELPAGIMLLKHLPTGRIFDGATFYYNTSSVVDMAGVTLPSTTGSDYLLITVGNDITTSIDHLRLKSQHSHSRAFGEPAVDVKDLAGNFALSHNNLGPLAPSGLAGNFFPQYLQRGGMDTGAEFDINRWNCMSGAVRFLYDDISANNDRGLRWAHSGYDGVTSHDITLSLQDDTGTDTEGLMELARVTGAGTLEDDFGEFRVRADLRANDFLLPVTYEKRMYFYPDERSDPNIGGPGLWHSYIHSPSVSAAAQLGTSGIISDAGGGSASGDETMVYPIMTVIDDAVYRVPFHAPSGSVITEIRVYFSGSTTVAPNYIHLYLNRILKDGGVAAFTDPVARIEGSSTILSPAATSGKLTQKYVSYACSTTADSDTLYAVEFANRAGTTFEVHYVRVTIQTDSLVSMLGWGVA